MTEINFRARIPKQVEQKAVVGKVSVICKEETLCKFFRMCTQ